MLYLVIAALLVRAAVVAAPMLLRRDKGHRELDRFRTARRLTTSWAGPQALADGPAGEG